jgi:hypothetical protein
MLAGPGMTVNILIRDAEGPVHNSISLLEDRDNPFKIVLFTHSRFYVVSKEFEEYLRLWRNNLNIQRYIFSDYLC